jgi:hypothetical protein
LADWIDQVEPPESIADAVEDLVRSTLLLADAMRLPGPASVRARAPRRRH